MKICLVHNEYGKTSGEEVVVQNIQQLLERRGHEVIPFIRSSAEIPNIKLGKLWAFFSGIYSFTSRREMRRLLQDYSPDIVHLHNLFPLISPSILPECRRAGVPVVMTVHNYRLICPNGLFLTGGRICEKCAGGKEYWCMLRNCEGNLFKSAGYAVRNWAARQGRFFLDNVTLFATLTNFQRRHLIKAGFPADRIEILPNMVEDNRASDQSVPGNYAGYIGRLSPEKGIPTLLKAARQNPQIPFQAAGNYDRMPALPGQAPQNLQLLGHLPKNRLQSFYTASRLVVLPSIWYEAFGLTVVEAMVHKKAIICSRIGGLPEIVEDGVTGLLFEPGNAQDLAEKIQYLWENPELAIKMGQAGREKALREYSPAKYYQGLMNIYHRALEMNDSFSARK